MEGGKGMVPQTDGRLPIEQRIESLRRGVEDGCLALMRRSERIHEEARGKPPSRNARWQEDISNIRKRASITYSIEELEGLCRKAGALEEELGRAESRLGL